MTEREENRIMAVAIGVLVTLIVLCCLCSCGAKKVTTETLYVHDTLRIVQSDTIRKSEDVMLALLESIEKYVSRSDSVSEKQHTTVTLNDNGDTVKVVNNYWHNNVTKEKDSESINAELLAVTISNYYKSHLDSILRAMDRQHEKEKAITKREPPWNVLIFVAAMLVACVIVLKDRK